MGDYRYGVVLDAGSSGTRVHIYRWLKSNVAKKLSNKTEQRQLPAVKTKNKKWTRKVKPGISTFGEEVDRVGPDHLRELLEFASDIVPKDEIGDTPIFLLATAGMRLLKPIPQKALLKEICRYTKEKTNFYISDCDQHIQVIPGETEGLYGWIAANYLVGGFDNPEGHDHGKEHHTYGFLDMGGASAQIAFAPNKTETEENPNDLTLLRMRSVNGATSEYRVFVTTFLGYGANEARHTYVGRLAEASPNAHELPDPCLPVGLRISVNGTIVDIKGSASAEPRLIGTGKFSECLAATNPLLDKDAACDNPPCLFHGVHVPAIDFDVNHFIGVSNFWHSTHEVFNMGHKDRAYDFKTYQERVTDFCSKDWEDIENGVKEEEWGSKVDEETAVEVCFKASWLINLLHDGIGVPRVGLETDSQADGKNGTTEIIENAKQRGFLQPFQAVNKIDDTEVAWTLGKIVLYASSQVQADDKKALPVGFGSNAPGIPNDFQYSGGAPAKINHGGNNTYTGTGELDDEEDLIYDSSTLSNWKTRLLNTANVPRRAPGFLLFLLIIIVAAILLCGRERRRNIGQKFLGLFRSDGGDGAFFRKRQREGAIRLPLSLRSSSKEARYDRLAEEGEMPNPQDFELHNFSSDDDISSRSSKGSIASNSSTRRKNGAVTPRRGAMGSPYGSQTSIVDFSQSGSTSAPQGVGMVGLGLGPTGMFDRNSSLDSGHNPVAGGHPTSRNASPSRWRSPILAPVKENVD